MTEFVSSFLTVILIILAVMVLLCLVRCVMGPRVTDRIVCVNMIGTLVVFMIAILAIKLEEGYLADICVIYAMISFLAVVVLCKVYLGVYLDRKNREFAALENDAEDLENVESIGNAEAVNATMNKETKEGSENVNA
ncbi:MAG: monovalent cation/H+ antiporter complex subunit F [Lachnospiraceae bacterium]|nr:monovalent cation/H+ antiporter complex subunit F [Lachnospiraceae bacterium]